MHYLANRFLLERYILAAYQPAFSTSWRQTTHAISWYQSRMRRQAHILSDLWAFLGNLHIELRCLAVVLSAAVSSRIAREHYSGAWTTYTDQVHHTSTQCTMYDPVGQSSALQGILNFMCFAFSSVRCISKIRQSPCWALTEYILQETRCICCTLYLTGNCHTAEASQCRTITSQNLWYVSSQRYCHVVPKSTLHECTLMTCARHSWTAACKSACLLCRSETSLMSGLLGPWRS